MGVAHRDASPTVYCWPAFCTVVTDRQPGPAQHSGDGLQLYAGRQLGERLRRHGLRPRQARSTALFQLATDLPAAVLARMLGIHISSAAAWQRASAGDWTGYAAEISHRTGQRD